MPKQSKYSDLLFDGKLALQLVGVNFFYFLIVVLSAKLSRLERLAA